MSSNKPVKQSGRKAAVYRGAKCLNCETPLDLSDVYCSYCGQLNTTKQLSLKDFFEEFIGSVLTYDSRLRFTIKDLLFKPGRITSNYVKGQRLKYANPFRFFLSVSIVYFLLQSLVNSLTGTTVFEVDGSSDRAVIDSILNSTDSIATAKNDKILDTLGFIKEAGLLNNDGISINEESKADTLVFSNDTIQANQEDKEEVSDYKSEAVLDTLSWADETITRFLTYRDFYKKSEIKNPSKALDSLKHNNTQFNRWLYDKNETVDRAMDDPYGFFDYLMAKVPFFLFFFIPIFAFFFWLIYSKRKYTYIEHMIFIFHVFSFYFLALLICLIPDTFFNDAVFSGVLTGLIGPFYFYKALRNFYKQGRLITILKFVFLNVVFAISATFAALLFFTITAATY